MASLKDLRNRIASVKATQKITKAMQMVAAAKLRKAQMAAEAARPYSAGGFNSSIARLARDKARALQADGKDVKILCVGKKGFDAMKMEFSSILLEPITFREVKNIGFGEANLVGKRLLSMFDDGEVDVCTLFYSEFQSVISQIPTEQQLIPANVTSSDDEEEASANVAYEYEPDEEELLKDLLPRNVSIQIFRAILENGASEQGARMSAMDNATRNAGEMIDKLTLSFNRQRQAQITKELIEIISGAEAL